MKIGTPLSAHATRLLLLGSGELGKELLIAAQRLGVETIAVDRYADAPAMQVAHRAHVIDMTDPTAILALVAREQPHYVVPEIEAIATGALAEIEARGLATVVPSARAVQLTMDREGIRRLAAEDLGLPTSPYRLPGGAGGGGCCPGFPLRGQAGDVLQRQGPVRRADAGGVKPGLAGGAVGRARGGRASDCRGLCGF